MKGVGRGIEGGGRVAKDCGEGLGGRKWNRRRSGGVGKVVGGRRCWVGGGGGGVWDVVWGGKGEGGAG